MVALYSVNALSWWKLQPLVIWDARVFLESGAFGFVPATGFADLGDAADGHLSRESEVLAQLVVVELLQFDLIGRPETESLASQPIGGGVESLHRGGKLLGLTSIRQELYLQGQFHAANYNSSGKFYHLNFRRKSISTVCSSKGQALQLIYGLDFLSIQA
jgi:hypothetical protein